MGIQIFAFAFCSAMAVLCGGMFLWSYLGNRPKRFLWIHGICTLVNVAGAALNLGVIIASACS